MQTRSCDEEKEKGKKRRRRRREGEGGREGGGRGEQLEGEREKTEECVLVIFLSFVASSWSFVCSTVRAA